MVEENNALNAKKKHDTTVEEAQDYIEHFDILETITNVGNDEVFTPRKTCDMLLDSLPEEVWHIPTYKWLNPATKNGVFEREIALRLDQGLKKIIPNKEKRRKHILQKMIFSIGQTKFTSNIARRTLYYCLQANRKCDGLKASDGHYVNGYAIGNGSWFKDEEGNIKTPNVEHEFIKFTNSKNNKISKNSNNKKCKYCGINEISKYNNNYQREKYAYEFIHHSNLNEYLKKFFGDKEMKFDIIIGNPPYQLSDGGGKQGQSAMPIYNLFVEQAISLNPKYLCMIIPSRWMTCGKGLDDFRKKMINSRHFEKLHDFINPKQCFPNNDIKGGVCYFLWDRDYDGKCEVNTHTHTHTHTSYRFLKENSFDIFFRFEELISIAKKITLIAVRYMESIVSARKPYGLAAETMLSTSKFGLPEFSNNEIKGGFKILGLNEKMKRTWKYLPKEYPIPKISPCLNKYKVFIAQAYGCGSIGEEISTPVLSTPVLSTPGELCTETFLEIGPFETKLEAENVIRYIKTKFFRTLVGIEKQTQSAVRKVYKYVPLLNFTNNSDIDWKKDIKDIDNQLFEKFKLNKDEIEFIVKNIREMY